MLRTRHLVIVLGDQLDSDSAALRDFDLDYDAIWMAEVAEESTHVPSHRVRIAYFLSAMRHFAAELRGRKYRVEYRFLDDTANTGSLGSELAAAVRKLKPEKVVMVEAGEYRVQEMLKGVVAKAGVVLEVRPDSHFYCSSEEFASYAGAHKQLRMEFFYREMRRKSGVLMDGAEPEGGTWNYDSENRKSFGKAGPSKVPAAHTFPPDKTTQEVIALVEKTFPKHVGSLKHFSLPVTAAQAETALKDFVEHRLAEFGDYQDAMWTDQPFLYHSRLSAALNLKLINPRRVLMAVEDAYRRGKAPLAATEGFIRQILGWREYVRGVYWTFMPKYVDKNTLNAKEKLPDFFWTGQTEMECLRQSIGQTLEYGYAHHIQRLMVTGLYSLLFGVDPVEIHKWYLAVYWDAIEWVEMPNVIGMSQFADGGIMASKPYAASGKYISRMSNYCQHCRYKPEESVGEDACPFTTLYWDFLLKHEPALAKNPRMVMQVRNLTRLTPEKKKSIQQQALEHRRSLAKGGY
jgi:deoxyribodipyrimidine photolyase-related protein